MAGRGIIALAGAVRRPLGGFGRRAASIHRPHRTERATRDARESWAYMAEVLSFRGLGLVWCPQQALSINDISLSGPGQLRAGWAQLPAASRGALEGDRPVRGLVGDAPRGALKVSDARVRPSRAAGAGVPRRPRPHGQ